MTEIEFQTAVKAVDSNPRRIVQVLLPEDK